MPHKIRWDVDLLKQDPGSKATFDKTSPDERAEVIAELQQWTEMFSSRQEIVDSGGLENTITISNNRKFFLQWICGDAVEGQPGYFVIRVFIFRRMN